MEKLLKKACSILLVIVFLAVTLTPKVRASVSYNFYGAYYEDGTQNLSGNNVTITKLSQAPETFFLNGSDTKTATVNATVFRFDLNYLGYNQSRTYYTINGAAEDVYVFTPIEILNTYYFEVIDYVGLQWGYLESTINCNGTDRVVERWRVDQTTSDLPFTMTWGVTYTMILVCDKGTYVYGTWTAGATTSKTYGVSSDMFPSAPTDISGLTVTADRMNATWIQAVFVDSNSSTNWAFFNITEWAETTAAKSYNTTSNSYTLNWYDAASDTDYYVTIEISHSLLGTKIWTFPCPAPVSSTNPFTILRELGDFPFDPAQIPAVLILVALGLSFSNFSIPIGLISELVVAVILVWLGWLAISWAWLTISGCIIIIFALAEAKEREPY